MRRRTVLALVLVLVVVAAVAITASVTSRALDRAGDPALAYVAQDQPGASTPACTSFMAALPATLAGGQRRQLNAAQPGVAGWGDPAVLVRCGLPNPASFTCSALLSVVNRVAWFQLDSTDGTTFVAMDRAVRVAVTLPTGVGVSALQEVAVVVAATLPGTAGPDGAVCRQGVLPPPAGG